MTIERSQGRRRPRTPSPGESPLPQGTALTDPNRDRRTGKFSPGNAASKLRALKANARHLIGLDPSRCAPWCRDFVALANADARRLVSEHGVADDTALVRLAENAAMANAVARGLAVLGLTGDGDRDALQASQAWAREYRQDLLTLKGEAREHARSRPVQWPFAPQPAQDERDEHEPDEHEPDEPDEPEGDDEGEGAPEDDPGPPDAPPQVDLRSPRQPTSRPAPEHIGRSIAVEMRTPTPIAQPAPAPPVKRTVLSHAPPVPAPMKGPYGIPVPQARQPQQAQSWSSWAAAQGHPVTGPQAPQTCAPAPAPTTPAELRYRGGLPETPDERWQREQAAKRGQPR